MKIQFHGEHTFSLAGKERAIAFDPKDGFEGVKLDFVALSNSHAYSDVEAKKVLTLPGEFEISEILVTSIFSDKKSQNVVYKVIMEGVSLVYFGNLQEIPNNKFFEKLGENFDIVLLNLGENFKGKEAKEMIELLDPRMVILGGDPQFFPKMAEIMGAKTAEENPIKVSRSSLSDDKTEILILPV